MSIGLHLGDLTQLLESLGSSLQVGALVKLDGVPQVQACFTSTSLVLGIYWEDTLEAIATQDVEHLIGRRDAGASAYGSTSHRALCLVKNVAHLRIELDQQFTLGSISRDGDVGLSLRRVDARQVVCTTCQS